MSPFKELINVTYPITLNAGDPDVHAIIVPDALATNIKRLYVRSLSFGMTLIDKVSRLVLGINDYVAVMKTGYPVLNHYLTVPANILITPTNQTSCVIVSPGGITQLGLFEQEVDTHSFQFFNFEITASLKNVAVNDLDVKFYIEMEGLYEKG